MTKKEFITICDGATYIDFLFYEKENEKYVVYLAGKWKEPVLEYYKQIDTFNNKKDAETFIEKYEGIVKNHCKHIDNLTLGKMK